MCELVSVWDSADRWRILYTAREIRTGCSNIPPGQSGMRQLHICFEGRIWHLQLLNFSDEQLWIIRSLSLLTWYWKLNLRIVEKSPMAQLHCWIIESLLLPTKELLNFIQFWNFMKIPVVIVLPLDFIYLLEPIIRNFVINQKICLHCVCIKYNILGSFSC